MSKRPFLSDFSKEEIKNELNKIRHPFDIAIIGADNYFNIGSIIRSAHVFLANQIYLIDCKAFYKKATMGTHKFENICSLSENEFIEKTLVENRSLVCFEKRLGLKSESLRTFQYPANPILVFGSEKTGIPNHLLEIQNNNNMTVVTIQQFGLHNDMNLSNVVAIAMYDYVNKNYNTLYPNIRQQ